MNKKLSFIVLVFFTTLIFSQSKKDIIGVWIKTNMETFDKSTTPLIQQRNNEYLKYTFERNGKLYISTEPNKKGRLLLYSIKGNILDLKFTKLKIERLNKKELVLLEFENNIITSSSTRTIFLSEQSFLNSINLRSEDILIKNGDSLYLETDKVYSKFINSNHANVKEFIQPFVEGLSENKDTFIYATFIIDEKGKISNIEIHHHINKKYDSEFKKAILKTNGMWIAPTVNGKKVKILKEISFHYIEYPDVEKKGNTIIVKPKNDYFPKVYKSKFKQATKAYLNGNFKEALNILSDLENLAPDDFNLVNLRRKIYQKTDDLANYEVLIKLLRSSKYNYILE
ncbi:hypothetical protein [Psychroserpens sp. SPM9]|uniref:hypothetical protein n=1 Tax=Psychroserpens sp. SPM9 TaxID=2975598 RepID=UPI0021A8D07D|nr:hypothetical protein [Psychroserpens sp. SPM9]MDG5493218.1 hypothetical protein [Psychroserpens sp. SPM9]